MNRRFYTLDVFTSRPLEGNPLAVVLDAQGLGAAAMAAIAREFNLSETVFVLPPDEPRHRAKLRIFTPSTELAFAGHPTIGTAALLALLDGAPAAAFGLEEPVGIVPCVVERRGDQAALACFRAPRLPERLGDGAPIEAAAAALGLAPSDVLAVSRWSAGTPFNMVQVSGVEALGKAKPTASFDDAFTLHPGVYLHTKLPGWRNHRARMFGPGLGVAEDPATGSAAAAFAGLLFAMDQPADGHHDVSIEQGVEMGRPSRIDLQLIVEAGALAGVEISGEAVIVSEGVLRI